MAEEGQRLGERRLRRYVAIERAFAVRYSGDATAPGQIAPPLSAVALLRGRLRARGHALQRRGERLKREQMR